MGEVYRAHDTRLGREVAVKVLPSQLSEHPEARARFEREARVAPGLNHPNICTVHDIGRAGDTDHLVMELVAGESLAQRLERGPLSISDALRVGGQIADALDRAHRAGIVHRDLKPANVMLSPSGAKLMDFGLARAVRPAIVLSGESPTIASLPAGPLTARGTIVGTFQYMSPEQIEGRDADARADIWALGCVLYEMATGRAPYEGATPASLMSSIIEDEPRPMAEIAPMVPASLDRVIRACLAKAPDDRWQSARDVAIALRWPAEDIRCAHGRSPTTAAERQFPLTTSQVRQLTDRNPRLVGYPLTFIDNRVETDTPVVLLHGLGADAGRFDRCDGPGRNAGDSENGSGGYRLAGTVACRPELFLTDVHHAGI
jgi:serine/threonine protein kinase